MAANGHQCRQGGEGTGSVNSHKVQAGSEGSVDAAHFPVVLTCCGCSTYDSYQYNPRGDRAYYSSDKHVLTLEMLRQDTNGQATPQVEQSANSTGLLVG